MNAADGETRTVSVSYPMCRRDRVVTTLQFLALWLVVVARSFVFGDFSNNEVDVLPVALQFANPDWLAVDWYLNLAASYRGLFNAIIGPFVSVLGFKGAAIAGRLVVQTLFASAVFAFLRTFRIRFSIGILFLLLFLNNQSIVALERMTGGFETKTFAWPFVLLSLVAVVRGRWLAAFAAAGAALSFHVLVGLYAIGCTVAGLVLNRKARLLELRDFRHAWAFCLTGAWGMFAVIQHLSSAGGASDGWRTYVTFRVPHHVLPDVWSGGLWIAKLAVGALVVIVTYRRARCPKIRFLAGYSIAAVGLFATGLLIWALNLPDLLRFYWFRFPDSMLPFSTLMLIAYFLSQRYESIVRRLGATRVRWLELALIAAVAVPAAVEIASELPKLRPGMRWANSSRAPMHDWISAHTPRDATFLVDPSDETFYVRAERSTFVSYKHSPQSAADIREWFNRLTLANGGLTPEGYGLRAAQRIGQRMHELSAAQLERIRDEYGVDYFLGNADHPLPFRVVHRTGDLILYDLNDSMPGS
jgi:hypothetical protein